MKQKQKIVLRLSWNYYRTNFIWIWVISDLNTLHHLEPKINGHQPASKRKIILSCWDLKRRDLRDIFFAGETFHPTWWKVAVYGNRNGYAYTKPVEMLFDTHPLKHSKGSRNWAHILIVNICLNFGDHFYPLSTILMFEPCFFSW